MLYKVFHILKIHKVQEIVVSDWGLHYKTFQLVEYVFCAKNTIIPEILHAL